MTDGHQNDEAPVNLPRATASLYGQDAAEQVLLRAWTSGRLPHAWLLTGPRGIGKATLAYRFACFLLAGGGGEGELFGDAPSDLGIDPRHPVALRVASGGHSDLLVLQRSLNKQGKLRSEIVVDDVRRAVEFMHLTPAEGGWRIVIVDPAEDMNPSSANALLKTLEEPPQKALLLLVSHAPGRLRDTIRSRCCHLALTPLQEATVVKLLQELKPELSAADQALLARLSDGSIGRALELAEEGRLELVRETLSLLEGLPQIDIPRMHKLADRLGAGSDWSAYRVAADMIGWWLSHVLHSRASGERAAIPEGDEQRLAELAASARSGRLLALWDEVIPLMARAERESLDRRHVTVSALLAFQRALA